MLSSGTSLELYKFDNHILPDSKRTRIEMLAGIHCVGIKWERAYVFVIYGMDTESGGDTLCFEAVGGENYIANHAFSEQMGASFYWIVDAASTRLVAGESPPEYVAADPEYPQ
jgi:hypothetical protein